MSQNTNMLWYIIVGAIIVIAIFTGVRAGLPELINDTFDSSKSTIDISGFDKNEIKYECFLFTNFKTDGGKLTADIENQCYNEKTYNLKVEVYSDAKTSKVISTGNQTVGANSKVTNKNLGSLSGISQIYTVKIKEA